MRLAQGLYERGYITYMRTDSTTLSATALAAARAQIGELFGDQFLPAQPRSYAKKSKNAQEAHEAIRPAGDAFRTPESLAGELSGAELEALRPDLEADPGLADGRRGGRVGGGEAGGDHGPAASAASSAPAAAPSPSPATCGPTSRGPTTPRPRSTTRSPRCPQLRQGEAVPVDALEPIGHVTSPPARYTEASLVKKLEELGIGRPSTYASIMGALASRYVWKKGQALVPDWVSFVVVRLLSEHFTQLIDYAFTAEMEDDLDQIAGRERGRVDFLKLFYFGDEKHTGLKALVERPRPDRRRRHQLHPHRPATPQGVLIEARPGRYGPYLKRGEDTASIPGNLAPDELTVEQALEILSAPTGGRLLGLDPATGLEVRVKSGRFGPYVQLAPPPARRRPRQGGRHQGEVEGEGEAARSRSRPSRCSSRWTRPR